MRKKNRYKVTMMGGMVAYVDRFAKLRCEITPNIQDVNPATKYTDVGIAELSIEEIKLFDEMQHADIQILDPEVQMDVVNDYDEWACDRHVIEEIELIK